MNLIPDEILLNIFTFLSWRSIVTCKRTCQQWYHILNTDKITENLSIDAMNSLILLFNDKEQILRDDTARPIDINGIESVLHINIELVQPSYFKITFFCEYIQSAILFNYDLITVTTMYKGWNGKNYIGQTYNNIPIVKLSFKEASEYIDVLNINDATNLTDSFSTYKLDEIYISIGRNNNSHQLIAIKNDYYLMVYEPSSNESTSITSLSVFKHKNILVGYFQGHTRIFMHNNIKKELHDIRCGKISSHVIFNDNIIFVTVTHIIIMNFYTVRITHFPNDNNIVKIMATHDRIIFLYNNNNKFSIKKIEFSH